MCPAAKPSAEARPDRTKTSSQASAGTPASHLYTVLRHKHGLSHTEATATLREALKGYFRTV